MGWISYLRAGAAQRQARSASDRAQSLADALQELAGGCARLAEIVDDHDAAIDELRDELADLRRRVDRQA